MTHREHQRRRLNRALAVVASMAVVGVVAPATQAYAAGPGGATPLVVPGNLLSNPSFEAGSGTGTGSTMTSWTLLSGGTPVGAGNGNVYRMSNNPYSGSYGFGTGSGATNGISQKVTVPYSGLYAAAGYVTVGGGSGQLAVRDAADVVIGSAPITAGSHVAGSPVRTDAVELRQGDQVDIRVQGSASAWLNGDDIAFTYDYSRVRYNLLTGVDLTTQSPWTANLPRSGSYNLSVAVTAGPSDATVTLDGVETRVPAGTTATVSGVSTAAAEGDHAVVAVTGTGVAVGSASLVFDVTSVPNDPPAATGVAVTGNPESGQQLVGTYTFTDPDGQSEGSSTYRWLAADTADGTFSALAGASTKALAITDAMEGKYLKFEVTPTDDFGLAGTAATSDPVGPAYINWIRNPGMEIETGGSPEGWTSSGSGVSLLNSPANAHAGFRVTQYETNATGGIAYPFTVARDGSYDVCFWAKGQNTNARTTTAGIREASSGTVLGSQQFTINSTAYARYCLGSPVALERGAKVEFFQAGASGSGWLWTDDYSVVQDASAPLTAYANILSFEVPGMAGTAVIDRTAHTVTAEVAYGSDLSALPVTLQISDGATAQPASGQTVDFSGGAVSITITPREGDPVVWQVTVTALPKRIALTSDNATLQDGFNWAVTKTDQFRVTGRQVPLEKWEGHGATATITGQPGYWAGYFDRSAYYGRDFAHQTAGAGLVGMNDETVAMLETFAKGSTEARKWFTPWAFNFDNETPLGIDYKSDTNFVREVPAMFELVQRAFEQYRWSGDERYLSPEMMAFYGHVMNEFVALHDSNGNGVAEGSPTGGGIWAGSATYNERGSHPLEAGDSIGSQYQATLAYAGFLEATGDAAQAASWYAKAEALKEYFNDTWSIIPAAAAGQPGSDTGLYVNILDITNTKAADWGKENSWFMPMKRITDPGTRNEGYLDFIVSQLGSGIGSSAAPNNIEAYTYLPDTFFPYNRADEAWKWMKYILSVKDRAHERPSQGTNGDYPEISFTLVSQTVEGMMGVEPNAARSSLSTIPRLPNDVDRVTVNHLMLGNQDLSLTHQGNTKSILTNTSNADVTWQVRFYASTGNIEVNDQVKASVGGVLNGIAYRSVTVVVPAGDSVTAELLAPADTSSLSDAVSAAGLLSPAGYTASSWNSLQEALTLAQSVLDDPAAAQQQVDDATRAVTDAVAALQLRGNPAVLESLVTAAEAVRDKLDVFTPASAAAFTEALDSASGVLAAADDSTQSQLDAAAAALQEAIGGLAAKPAAPVHTTLLRSMAESAGAISNADGTYTAESWRLLQEELATARAVLDSPSPTQQQVDAAGQQLIAAMAGLKVAELVPLTLKLNQTQLSLVKGKSFTLEEGVYYRDLLVAYSGAVTWTSSNPAVATVSSAGKVKAKKPGTTTITVATIAAGSSGEKLVTAIKVTVVKKKPKAKVTKVKASVPAQLKLGEVLYITGTYSSAKATGVKVSYSTSKPDIVVIDKVGRLVAKTRGTEYVKVKAGGKTKAYKVTVS